MKEKISHFWYYYKVHCIAVLCALLLLALGIKSCEDRTETDFKMVYFSNQLMNDETAENLEKELTDKGFVRDMDGDGNVNFYVDRILDDFRVDGGADESTVQKIQTVVYAGDHTLMLVHQYALEDYEGIYADISHMMRDEDKVFTDLENNVVGISVEGNTLLEDMGINTEGLHVAMRRRTDREVEKGENREAFDAAYEAMEYILSFNEVVN